MGMDIRNTYTWYNILVCVFCIAVCTGHVDGGKKDSKCFQFDSVMALMEQSTQLRVELEALKKVVEENVETAEQRKTVAFCASDQTNLSPGSVGETLIYSNIDFNQGQRATYLPSTGTFVAMEPGLYLVSVHFCNTPNQAAGLGIKHNEDVLVKSVAQGPKSSCVTASSYVTLEPGDTVTVVNLYQHSHFLQNEYRTNRFCAHRISSAVN